MGEAVASARRYIGKVRWQYAVTMPDWPHEYTIKAWRPELAAEFEAFCRSIADQGSIEAWPPPPARAVYHNHYLMLDGYKYWAMGPHGDRDVPEQMTVINRASRP
jgi:hypothetical protein